jgi:hypothetical protein
MSAGSNAASKAEGFVSNNGSQAGKLKPVYCSSNTGIGFYHIRFLSFYLSFCTIHSMLFSKVFVQFYFIFKYLITNTTRHSVFSSLNIIC